MSFCKSCGQELSYDPLECAACDARLCLQCSTDGEITLCATCLAKQQAEIRTFCIEPGCKNTALRQGCSSILYHPRRQGKYCPGVVQHCDEHIKKCTCGRILCSECYGRGTCAHHGVPCSTCANSFAFKLLYNCEMCDSVYCGKCADTKLHREIHREPKFNICHNHQYTCGENVYRVFPSGYCAQIKYYEAKFLCHVPGCIKYACVYGWFLSGDKRVFYCHDHVIQCKICALIRPIVEEKAVVLRNARLVSCVKCYTALQTTIDLVIRYLRRNRIKMPRDILNMIINLLV